MCGNYSNSFNFFHFLTDSIAPNYNSDIANTQIPILLPVIGNSFQNEILDKLNINNYLEVDTTIQVSSLRLNLRTSKWSRNVYKLVRSSLALLIAMKMLIKKLFMLLGQVVLEIIKMNMC